MLCPIALRPLEPSRMPSTPVSSSVPRPTVDEWGVYDPQQAGLAALYMRLIDTPAGTHPTDARPAATSKVAAGPKEPAR